MVTLEDLAKREYDVEGRRLRPTKVWKVQPKGRKGFVMALFKTPDGKTVRKVIAKSRRTRKHNNLISQRGNSNLN